MYCVNMELPKTLLVSWFSSIFSERPNTSVLNKGSLWIHKCNVAIWLIPSQESCMNVVNIFLHTPSRETRNVRRVRVGKLNFWTTYIIFLPPKVWESRNVESAEDMFQARPSIRQRSRIRLSRSYHTKNLEIIAPLKKKLRNIWSPLC